MSDVTAVVTPQIWRDKKFLALSYPQGKFAWFYLINGPHITALPGLWKFHPEDMARDLGWSMNDVYAALKEIVDAGLAQFDGVGVLYVPKTIKYRPPYSPSHVLGYGPLFDDIPDGDLKSAFRAMMMRWCWRYIGSWRTAFARAFHEPESEQREKSDPESDPELQDPEDTIRGQNRAGMSRAVKDQDLLQTQDQDRRSKPERKPKPTRERAPRVPDPFSDFSKYAYESWAEIYGRTKWTRKEWAALEKAYRLCTDENARTSWGAFLKRKGQFVDGHLPSKWLITGPATYLKAAGATRRMGDF